jgi:hypothetical protein
MNTDVNLQETNAENDSFTGVNNSETKQEETAKKYPWADADLSFFPFLKSGFHYFKIYGLKKSDTWEKENGQKATKYWYRCMPIDADNLEECKDMNLYPVFQSYEDIRKNAMVICKKSEGIFQVFSVDEA